MQRPCYDNEMNCARLILDRAAATARAVTRTFAGIAFKTT